MNTGLKILLIVHSIVTLAAGVVLMIDPALIPSAVNISIDPNTFLICYLLAAMELAIAFISFTAIYIQDNKSLQIISLTFIILHLSTALMELYALNQGLSSKIWGNIVLRIIVSMLFGYFGIYKIRKIK